MMIEFYEKPMAGKEHLGYYDGVEIDRPMWVWHMYRDLEFVGVRFHIVIGNQISLIAKFKGEILYTEQHPNDQAIGKRVDNFIQMTTLKLKNGTTVVEETKNEDIVSQSPEVPQLREDQLDTPSEGSLPDRRAESGNGESEHGGEDDPAGLDLLGGIRVSTEVG